MSRLSVRRFLAVSFAAVGLLPLCLFSVNVWTLLKTHLNEDTEEIVKNALRYVSMQTSAVIAADPARMLPPILLSAGGSTDTDFLRSLLLTARATRPDILRLAILDADHRILCAYPFSQNDVGKTYSLKTNAAEGFVNHSTPFYSPTIQNENRISLETSFSSGDRTVVSVLDLTGISIRLTLSKISTYDRIGVVDDTGHYILCSDPARVISGERLAVEALGMTPTLIEQDDGFFFVTALSIPSSEWKAVYLRSQFVSDAPIRQFYRLLSRLAALSIIVAAAAAYLAWRTVTRPLKSLIARIELIAEGRYSERVAGPYPEEFGAIADSFNAMADSVERRELDLHRSEERYRLLFSGSLAPVILIDYVNGAIRDANPAAVRFYGLAIDELTALRIDSIDTEPYDSIFSRMLDAAENRRTIISRHRLKDGRIRDVELYIYPIAFEDRRFMHTIVFDVTERLAAEKAMAASLNEKDKLLKEIDHRVHNNQQLVVSLLHMQAETEKSEESRKALKKAHDRMFAMALAHDMIYQMENLSLVDLKEFAERLVQNYTLNYGRRTRRTKLEIQDIRLELEQAIPFALALNEFVSAALLTDVETASPLTLSIRSNSAGNRPGEVFVAISVEPDGSEIPSAEASVLSVSLTMAIAGQLRGSASWYAETETGERRATLRFPIVAANGTVGIQAR